MAMALALGFVVACGSSATATPESAGESTEPTQAAAAATAAPAATTAPAATQPGSAPATRAPVAAPTAVPTPAPAPAGAAWIGVAPGGKHGGVVPTYHVGNPGVWDPHRSPSGASMAAISKAYNQVLQWNPIVAGEIIGDVAETWEILDEGNTFLFRIHDGIRWWDGETLDAEDVAFSINRMIEPEEPRPRSGIIRTYVETAEAVDPSTVKVSLKYPAAAYLSYMASDYMKIVSPHAIEAGLDINNFDNVMGSGPFRPTEFKQGDVVRYERNEDYFKGELPYFDGIDNFIIVDNARAIAAFLAEQVHMCNFPYCDFILEEFLQLEEKGKDFLTIWWEAPSIIGWGNLNVNHPPLDNPNVRRAIYLAIDREEIINAVGGRQELSSGSPFPPAYSRTEEEILQIPGFRQTPDGKKDPADLAEARRLLAEAGFPDGEGFPKMDMVIRTVVAVYADMGAIIKQQLRDNLGIQDIELRLVESAAGLQAYRQGEWDMAAQFVGLINTDPEDILQQVYNEQGAWNWSRWTSPEYEELFQRQSEEQDPAVRREILREMELYLYETPKHAIELFWKKHAWVVNNKIGGFEAAPELVNCCMKLEHLWYK
jgi:ABC-type transport system substrate-binding protein